MIITHNINRIKVTNKLLKNEKRSSKSMERISSGLKINSASDDAAGSSISVKFKAQIRGLSRAQMNVQDGIQLSTQMSSSLDLISDNSLIRLRELSVKGANDTSGVDDKKAMQNEIDQILKDIDSIANGTEFNGKKLLAPPLDPINIQAGANGGDIFKIELFDVRVSSLGLDGINVSTIGGSVQALDKIDTAINKIADYVGKTGSNEEGLHYFSGKLAEYEQELTSSNSRIEDTDLAKESLDLAQRNILTQATQAILLQSNQSTESVRQLLQ